MRDSTRYKKVYPYLRQDPKFVPTNAFLSGADVPEISMGTIGDFYLKTQGPSAPPPSSNSVLLYGPKTSLGWSTTPIELVGLNGDQGPKGDPGEPGATGPQGETGETGPIGPSYDGKTGNTIWVTKQTDGAYTSLQDAVDQSVSGDTILVGAGNWGEVDLSEKPGISLMGLQPPLADEVILSKLTFAPNSGTAVTNTVYIANLRISSNSDVSVLELGHASFPVRVTMSGVRVYRNNSAATTAMVACIGNVTEASIYMKDCMFTHESGQTGSGVLLMQSDTRYLDLVSCQFSGGGRCLDVTAGTVAGSSVRFETESSISCIRVGASSQLALGYSLVRNLGTNSSGIELVNATTSLCAAANTTLDIIAGSGAAVYGSGIFVPNNLIVLPAAVAAPLGGRNSSVAGVTRINFTAL